MKRSLLLVVVLVVLVVSTACGPREPGPHEAEYGEVFYWSVLAANVTFGESCTDDLNFRQDIQPPEITENSFVIYRLNEDGTEAVAQDCDTTRADSCADSDVGITFTVSGHDLVWDAEPMVQDVEDSACDLEADQLWALTDQGETLDMAVAIQFGLVGDAATCDALQTQVESQSANDQGLDGCEVTLTVDAEFFGTDS